MIILSDPFAVAAVAAALLNEFVLCALSEGIISPDVVFMKLRKDMEETEDIERALGRGRLFEIEQNEIHHLRLVESQIFQR